MILNTTEYVKFFRQSSPYIHAHRGKTFVMMLSGETVDHPNLPHIIHDIALLSSLGVRLVLVHGARPQIDERIRSRELERVFHNDVRVTDKAALECVKDAVGSLRLKLEAQLSTGLVNSPMYGSRIRVVSGNYVTAQPLGVVDGIDYLHSGEVRRIDAKGISRQLDEGNVVLLSCIGLSSTAEIFNLPVESVAHQTAQELKAEKLIMFSANKGLFNAEGELTRSIRPLEARHKLLPCQDAEGRRLLMAALEAGQGGVMRTHIISHEDDGSLLVELFTRDGAGTLLTLDRYEEMRTASIEDVGGILELIRPLEEKGILVRRSRKQIEREIGLFSVIVRDGMIIGCAALHLFKDGHSGELACIVVHPDYRRSDRGDVLLEQIESRAREEGISRLFVLTTRTSHWFAERGFEQVMVTDLPQDRQNSYPVARASKVLMKTLDE
ncbi:amino-acid N-acetyltransferase [Spongorhabdus nitratireducens]